MKKTTLDREETELEASIARGEWQSVPNLKRELARYGRIAKQTLNKNRRINIRISDRDYDQIQVRALEEGIPYQTLISSLIHKYLAGKLKTTS